MEGVIYFDKPNEKNGYLDNCYILDFVVDNINYSSMEQYMAYEMAILFEDYTIANKILETSDIKEIKILKDKIIKVSSELWNSNKINIAITGLNAKFSQNNDLAIKLLSTSHSVLAKCGDDKEWGIGLDIKDPNRLNILYWRGANLLGFCLMKVRDNLVV